MRTYLITTAALAVVLTGCATVQPAPDSTASDGYQFVANPRFSAIASAMTPVAKDRQAILAMQGDYRVSFDFMETVRLAADYGERAEKTAGAYETVIVVEESPRHVVLQHILVAPGGHVIKHWRQDWMYEANTRFEFTSDQTWEVRPLDAEKTAGAWTQCVFEVSDAPRYCGTGRWNHRYGVSTWTSDRTWRPLPRREYTTREDYNALNAENRHTVTPHGWTHEQDNTKTIRDGEVTRETLVREFGFNDYRNITGYDFSPAEAYWSRTSGFWARVRHAWSVRLEAGDRLHLTTDVSGMPIIVGMFEHAETIADAPTDTQDAAIEALLAEHSEQQVVVSSR